MKLSDTARVVLSRAAQHPERLAEPPKHLPAAARDAVVRSLLKNTLLAEVPCPREHLALAWRQDEDGAHIALQVTDAGLAAIGIEPAPETTVDAMERGGLCAHARMAPKQVDASHASLRRWRGRIGFISGPASAAPSAPTSPAGPGSLGRGIACSPSRA